MARKETASSIVILLSGRAVSRKRSTMAPPKNQNASAGRTANPIPSPSADQPARLVAWGLPAPTARPTRTVAAWPMP